MCLYLSLSVHHMCAWCSGGQTWLVNPLEPELWMAVRGHVGAKSQQGPLKSSQRSRPPGYSQGQVAQQRHGKCTQLLLSEEPLDRRELRERLQGSPSAFRYHNHPNDVRGPVWRLGPGQQWGWEGGAAMEKGRGRVLGGLWPPWQRPQAAAVGPALLLLPVLNPALVQTSPST